MKAFRKVVITGLGSLTPIGLDNKSYWQGLINGVSGAAPITYFDTSAHKTKFACELKGYKPEDYFDQKEIKKLDPCSQYALITTNEALQDAHLDVAKIDSERIGVIWGTGIGGMKSMQDGVIDFAKNDLVPKFSPFFITKMIANMPSAQISIKYGFKGPNYVTVSACASASHALISAVQSIQLDLADIMITGGTEAAITPVGIGGFNVIKALSERNNDPQTASRPFDKNRDGFVLGEGAGALVLEELTHAQKRGAYIYAEILGIGMSSEAYHITAPEPEGTGPVLVMNNALKNANINPRDVEYINVHGTSTSLGDVSEIKAIQKVFKEHVYNINISSTKSMIGHLLGAASALETNACILALKNGIIPPTINHFELDPALDPKLNYTFNKAQKKNFTIAMNNSFGFGGHNTAIIFKKWID